MEGAILVNGGVDKYKAIEDKTGSSYKGSEDNHINAFAVCLDDGDKEYYRPSGLRWSDYTIEFAQFCQQPLSNQILDIGSKLIDNISNFELLPTKKEGKTEDETLKALGISKGDISQERWLPSPHHRFIRFRTGQCYSVSSACTTRQPKVWGILERGYDGVVCALYKSDRESLRTEAKVVEIGWLSTKLTLENLSLSLEDVFRGIGGRWKGKYHLINNNCIHYALECWRRLGGRASWDDVVGGRAGIPQKYNPDAPPDSDVSNCVLQ